MSLSQLAEIGSFVSGVAILASLIFLYFQLRQINKQVKQAEKISSPPFDRREQVAASALFLQEPNLLWLMRSSKARSVTKTFL